MKRIIPAVAALFCICLSCTMQNPLISESQLPFGAPQFDKIKKSDYLPAFEQALKEAKAEVDAIVSNPEAPTFANTIEALEYSGRTLDRVSGIFYNLLEADTDDRMQEIAEEISPKMTEFSMYVSLNEALFARIKAVYEQRGTLGLEPEEMKLLEDTYKDFERGGANLCAEDKAEYSRLSEELSLLSLKFGKNALAATNAYTLDISDPAVVEELPDFVKEAAAETAREKGHGGWTFDLSFPSYSAFMKYSSNRELKQQIYKAYNSKALGGEFDNSEVVADIVEHRARIARILGYPDYAAYAIEERMAKSSESVENFLDWLLEPSLPVARKELAELLEYAHSEGFEGDTIMPWDLSYWSEKLKDSRYAVGDSLLKPYFRLEKCVDAVFGLAGSLYGLKFTERSDIPVYHKDVKVYEVTDSTGRHMALFYADFFPRKSKRSGAWMTEFRGQSIVGGVEERPFVSIVTNFTKPTTKTPSLLTHNELTTLLHEFGHALHGMLAEGRYGSQTGTSVAEDFVELPSQLMENWAYESEFLNTFAIHYQTGEPIPGELIARIKAAENYQAAYLQVRQLNFGLLDMAWHTLESRPEMGIEEFESATLAKSQVLPIVPGCCISTSFSHIFSGGYSAGYYSYKWSEVLEADAFSYFKETGLMGGEAARKFRENILSKGSTEDEAELYRKFRGRDPEPEALLRKLEII